MKCNHVRLGKIYTKLIKDLDFVDNQIATNYIDTQDIKELKEEKICLEFKISRVENMIFKLWGIV